MESSVGGGYEKVPDVPEDNWVWEPIGVKGLLSGPILSFCISLHFSGVIDVHLPERWGILQFSDGPVNGTEVNGGERIGDGGCRVKEIDNGRKDCEFFPNIICVTE